MIRKEEELDNKSKKVSSFKKFSELKLKNSDVDGSETVLPFGDSDLPMNPNLPNKGKKYPKNTDTTDVRPKNVETDIKNDKDYSDQYPKADRPEDSTNEKVKFYGKVAKFPKKTKASKAYNFLESVKISKSSIWYIMVERQDNELQMIKYNYKQGVDLSKFVNELKSFYTKKYNNNKEIVKLVEKIEVDGNNSFSMIKNIPTVDIEGKKMITKITEDLIRLLSK
jgi:hypothetical protein